MTLIGDLGLVQPVKKRGVRLSEFDVCNRIVENISRVIVGKAAAIELLMVALLGDGL